MSLREFHQVNGRHLSVDKDTVIFVEPHESGNGTVIRIAPADKPTEFWLKEDYATVRRDVTESAMERAARQFIEDGSPLAFGGGTSN